MRALALAFFLCAGSAGAQTMYRCGSTYSQQPCGPGATEIKTAGVQQPVVQTPADPEKVEPLKAQCKQMIVSVPSWKDRDSLKVGEVTRGRLQTRTINGDSRRVWMYGAFVNAKNSMGGYTGDKPAVCWVDEAETKVLDIYVAG